MLVVHDTVTRAMLTALIGVAGRLNDAVMHLFTNDDVPDHTTLLASMTEATFAGYAPSTAIVWGTVFTDPSLYAHTVGDTKQFTAGALAGAVVVHGYYVVDAGGALAYAERFDAPANLVVP